MTAFTFVSAWLRPDPARIEETARFWLTHGLMEPEAVEDSAHGACAMAYAGRRLAGVTAVDFRTYSPLRSRLAFVHCAVAPEFRRQGLARRLVRQSLVVMEGWSLEHPEEGLQGLAAIIKTPDLKEKAKDPVWTDPYANLNLAGFTPKGGQVRLAWFRHAQVAG
jgi:GNAT superfamily N-acetyltransferase